MRDGEKMISISRTIIAALVCMLAFCACANAIPVTLNDPLLNSTVRIDPTSQAGNFDWIVESYDQMGQSGYYFRIGDTGLATAFSAMGPATVDQVHSTYAIVNYTGEQFDAAIHYVLYASPVGSGMSDLSETVVITNKTTGILENFHLFEFIDFDLAGSTTGAVAVNPGPSHAQGGDPTSLLSALNTTSGLNLNDSFAPSPDFAIAFQWDMDLALRPWSARTN